MKKISLILLLCFYISNVIAQNNDIVIGKIDSINSKILNEQRKIWVYTPEEKTIGKFEKKNYPVVYLLDGEAHFYSVVGMIRQLSSSNGNSIVPKMIVVGIPNTNRTRDLTPTKGTPNPRITDNLIETSGGGENFMSFLEKELIPYINSNYPTKPYKLLIGHSFGGLTVMNTLVQQPELFDSYVSIDPSMWGSDRQLLNEIKAKKNDKKYEHKKLFLAIANTINGRMDTSSVKRDTNFQTDHIRSILELNSCLNQNSIKDLNYKSKYYQEEDHGSVPLIAEYDAFRFIFDFYKLKVNYLQDILNPESNFLNKIMNHYQDLSKEFRMEIKPEEALVNSYGYQFLSMKHLKKSEEFFKYNVSNYPESFNVYDSLGDFYSAIGNKKGAIENYRKAISINENSKLSIQKLEALEME